jgi:AbiV family abortive infection protein
VPRKTPPSDSDKSVHTPEVSAVELLKQFVDAIPPDIKKEADAKAVAKKQTQRMLPFFKQAAELANYVEPLGIGSDQKDDWKAYQRIVDHALQLWRDAVLLFKNRRYAPSIFLSIVTMEEVGKVTVARMQLFMSEARRKARPGKIPQAKGRNSALYSHTQKHLMAACSGAVINAHLDRALGQDNIIRFLDEVEAKKIENLRQDTLYFELRAGGQHLPYRTFDKATAKIYVALAGELLAEVGGTVGKDWSDLLEEVERFERSCGYHP